MTKQDYEIIASVINRTRARIASDVIDADQALDMCDGVMAFAIEFANRAKEQNPRFDKERFYSACGFGVGV